MKHIKHILWDLDGLFFVQDDTYTNALINALAKYVSKTKNDISFDEALALAVQAQAAGRMFDPFITRYGYSYEGFAEPVYRGLDIGFMAPQTGLLPKLAATGTTHAIVTKSNMPWARRVLKQIDLEAAFPEAFITACADFIETQPEFSKAHSTLPYQHTLDRHGWLPQHTVMVEDTQHNLKHAKALGLTTVLVHSTEPQAEYTDYVFGTPEAFLDYFNPPKPN